MDLLVKTEQVRLLFLRLVTGLAFPTSGTLSLWGNSGTEELQKQRKRIGSMIETPALFPSMTAYQNMEVQRIQRGIPDKSVIKRTLDMVGLQDTGKKSVRNFFIRYASTIGDSDCTFKYTRTIDFRRAYQWS